MSIMYFFTSRNRVFELDPHLHFLLALVSFQSCFFLFPVFYLYYVLFIYYSQYCFVLFHLLHTFFFLFSFVATMVFIPYHHLPIYYTDSKSNALYMSVISFFMSRNRVFLLDPYLHFLFTLVSFQSCLFSFVLLLLVLCVVYILFQYCFVMFHLLHILSLFSHSFKLCFFFPAITSKHIILCISSFQFCVVYLLHCFPSLLSFISFVMSFRLFLPSCSCILCLSHGF